MKQQPFAKLEFDEAQELAHLESISQDLFFVVQVTKKLAALLDSASDDHVTIRSLYTAALVAYVRCFTSSKRRPLSPDIYASLPGDPLGCHAYYKNMRDKHIAHSVNPFEEMMVGALLSPSDSPARKVEGVGCLVASRLTDTKEGVEQLGQLAAFAYNHLKAITSQLRDQVLAKAKTLNVDSLYLAGRLRYTAPSSDAAGTARKA